jgi:hypothetical protein
MADNRNDLMIEDAKIMFRNFTGQERPFNSEGDRNFCIFLEEPLAEAMRQDGWNVKRLRPQEDQEVGQAYVQVSVNYKKGRPPRCVMVSSRGRTELGQDEVAILDVAELKKVDVILNPYHWDVNGNKGVKAYLKTIYATINEDELELKYADLQDASMTPASFGGDEE